MLPETWCMTDVIIFHFGPFFALLSLNSPKNQNFTKMKKTPRDIILHTCTKNYDQMMYSSWDMVHDRYNYFLFWAIFCPFTQQPKKSKFRKNERNTQRYHHFTYVYQKLWSDDKRFLRYGVRQMDGWVDGKSDM